MKKEPVLVDGRATQCWILDLQEIAGTGDASVAFIVKFRSCTNPHTMGHPTQTTAVHIQLLPAVQLPKQLAHLSLGFACCSSTPVLAWGAMPLHHQRTKPPSRRL